MKPTQTNQKCNFIYITLLLLLALLIFPLLSNAQTTIPFEKRFESTGINGELTIIGNSILGETSNQPYNGTDRNNDIEMVFVDIDGDASTFNSSSANFTTGSCNRVVYAGLYWGAVSAPSDPAPNVIKFKIPGGSYQTLTADITNSSLREDLGLIYYKDVTSIVTSITNPNGDYYVADLSTNEGTNNAAGWSLVIVYEDPSEPRKYISTFDGLSYVNDAPYETVDFSYSGFTTPPSGPVEGKVGVAALEGDLGLYGDQMQFKADGKPGFTALYDPANDVDNFFSSNITHDGAIVTNRNLNSTNTLGWDQKILDITPLNGGNSLIGNGETGATVRVTNTTGGDHIFTFLNTFSINIIEPVLQVLTSVEDTSNNPITYNSPVPLGATVWYNINFKNIGTDDATNTVVTNTLPINVTLDDTTFEFLDASGTPLAPGLITYTFNAATRQITFTIDDTLVLKNSASDSYNIRYQVTASDNCFDYTDACTNLLQNTISSSYGGVTSGENVSDQPGLIGINGCGLPNVGSMDLFVDTSSCQFDSTEQYCNNNLTISGHDGYNLYEWVDQDNNDLGTGQTITVTGPGIYTVTQTKTGCTVTTRTITVLGLDVTFTPSDALCKDSADGKVNITVVDDAATFTYELSQGGSVIATQGPTASKSHDFTGLDIGTYSVKVTNTDGCFDVQQFTIGEPTLLQATNSVLDNIMPCNGNVLSGRIEATGTGGTAPYQYSINNGTTYQDSNIFEVTTEGNHTITVRDANGCTTTTVANIDFDQEIEYAVEKVDVVCYGGSDGSININVSQNSAGNTLSYSIDGGTTFQSSSSFTGLTSGDYQIIIRKVKGVNTCETIESVSIDQLTFLELTADAGFKCEGSENQIIANVAAQYQNEVEYSLNGGSYQSSNVFENVPNGEHTVRVRNTSTGCTDEPVVVNVEAYTPVSLDIQNTNSLVEYVVNASNGEPEYQYAMLKNTDKLISPDVNESDFGSNNVFSVSGAGFYTFYVKDNKGCIVSEIIEVKDIEIPNFFTPDGDGINDTWYPRNIEIYPDITVKIFDRYQRLITEYKGTQQSWNGVYKGKLLPSGDYWYIIKLNAPNDKREFKGNFTLYR
ncbi:T9SS type B sorting domain-containing protein [Aureibaculum sp. 2210JD6-5]|uniref:T9SS type B sorting domain-containing protein n=1 Tax=Aureibaculum sp. 2210JD6-5 TaxID=3103957 RepID=UPI002AACA313|nr:T9SS type B sorting domain-containing protein [Aureibaculum sp. 2210JD6-5]MDY7395538.1 T9SS type B sorting domain-containing protein [Aureibaculum sp. 2210JD6-5]